MANAILAGRYARALAGVIKDDSQLETVLNELRDLSEAINTCHDLYMCLNNPVIDVRHREAVYDAVLRKFNVGSITEGLTDELLRRGRAVMLPEITEAFAREVDKRLGREMARVTTAYPLTDEQRQQIIEGLERFCGKKIYLKETVAPEIIGGVIVQLSDRVIDGSLQTQLTMIKEALVGEEA